MVLTFNLAPNYRDLKDPTSRQNFDDTPGQIPKLILTLRHIFSESLVSGDDNDQDTDLQKKDTDKDKYKVLPIPIVCYIF